MFVQTFRGDIFRRTPHERPPVLDWYERNTGVKGMERSTEPGGPQLNAEPSTSFWADIEEIFQGVPEEEWSKLPADGSEQVDHYLYGWPKQPR